MSDDTASKLEKLHVHEVYEKIADHFSETRYLFKGAFRLSSNDSQELQETPLAKSYKDDNSKKQKMLYGALKDLLPQRAENLPTRKYFIISILTHFLWKH